MPDLFEGQSTSAFELPGDEELLGRATEEPEAAVVEEPEVQERERDDKGRYAKQEEAPEETPEVTADDTDSELETYLAKYGGDKDKALQAAVEAQKLIGRKESELQELRDELNQRFDQFEERVTPPAPTYDAEQVQERLAENPALISQVAQAAYEEGNEDILDVAIVAWEDHDPHGAKRFQRRIAAMEANKALQVQTQRVQAQQNTWDRTAEAFAKDHPDFDTFAPKMMEIAGDYPNMLKMLEQGGDKAQLEVLDFLYEKAQRRTSDTAETHYREATAEADRKVEEAAVISGQTAHSEKKLSPAEEMGKIWEDARRPYDDGWNV